MNAPSKEGRLRPLAALLLAATPLAVLSIGGCSPAASSSSENLPSEMYILSCSLGCTDGTGGQLVQCSIINTFRNQEISVLFSDAIDIFSVNASSFRVLDISNGTSPPGEFSLDPFNSRRLIFRPALDFDANGNPQFGFNAFTSYLVTIPGQEQGDPPPYITSTDGRSNLSRLQCTIETSNEILDPVPGPPSVEILTDVYLGDDALGDPILDTDRVVNGGTELVNVWSGTDLAPPSIRMVFNDVMNLASVVNPQTGTAPFIFIDVDADGDLATDDRVTIPGTFKEPGPPINAFVDQSTLQTFLVFEAAEAFPSAGGGAPANPRRITVDVREGVVDLVGNPTTVENGGGLHSMVPIQVVFQPLEITDDFAFNSPNPASNEDAARTAGDWGGGQLSASSAGPAGYGGSGRLGSLHITTGQVVTLNTDNQVFPLLPTDPIEVLGNRNDGDPVPPDGTPQGFPAEITVTDGVFEFTTLRIDPGGLLRLEGTNPARIYVCGPVEIANGGLISLTGVTPAAHDSQTIERSLPTFWGIGQAYDLDELVQHQPDLTMPARRYASLAPGNLGVEPGVDLNWELSWEDQGLAYAINAAGGGDGGFGADRYSRPDSTDFAFLGPPSDSVSVPGGNTVARAVSLSGQEGQGVGRATVFGRGRGGARVPGPDDDPYPNNIAGTTGADHDLNFNVIPFAGVGSDDVCTVTLVAGVGSGGAYSLSGTGGTSNSPQALAEFPLDASNAGVPTPAGDAAELGLAEPSITNDFYIQRKLFWRPNATTPYPGFLRGGSGGGGGANHAYGAQTNGHDGGNTNDCWVAGAGLPAGTWREWHDHSGAQGGYGGGALQLVSGQSILVNGVIDARGGDGGSALTGLPGEFFQYALPGGGGSGGAINLRSPVVELGTQPGRLDIRGGDGGFAAWAGADFGGDPNLRGGDGGAGLVRIEEASGAVTHAGYAGSILPFDAVADPDSLDFLSVAAGGFAYTRHRPEGISSSMSCWIRPPGNYFALNFREDAPGTDPDDMGWNMTVLWQPPGAPTETEVPFRGVNGNSPFAGSFEAEFGTDLGPLGPSAEAAPIVVRFQGARAAQALGENNNGLPDDPCNLDLTGVDGYVVPGSVSPWVDHPALLNDWADAYDRPTPNMIRYTIIFDGTLSEDLPGDDPGLISGLSVNGVTDLRISADPD